MAEGTGKKNDTGKTRLDLLPWDALALIGKVFTHGSIKYTAYNWCGGIHYSRLMAALLRHMGKWWLGQDNDSDSGIHHLGHAGCCMLMLISMALTRPDLDDRFKNPNLTPEQLDSLINELFGVE